MILSLNAPRYGLKIMERAQYADEIEISLENKRDEVSLKCFKRKKTFYISLFKKNPQWSNLANDLNTVATIKFPRKYSSETPKTGSYS
jgi:hypothetical protein